MSILPLDKFARLLRIINQHGGIGKSLYALWRLDTLKEGKLMGEDKMFNKYYENQNYMLGRSRWVVYSPKVSWNYDASQVAPEWYGWLHYKTDRLPNEDCAKFRLFCCTWSCRWMLPHMENATATNCAYYPYSTERPRIRTWDGLNVSRRLGACK